MITDLFISFVLISFLVFGISRPHLALCAVIWIDILKPQNMSFSFLAGKPLSLIVTAFFFVSFFLNIKKVKLPKSKLYLFVVPLFMLWITIATFQAHFPNVAWLKYDFVIKTLILIFFIPFVLSERRHYELFLAVCLASFGMFLTMAGVKSTLGGGGYGVSLVGIGGFMYSEGSTLACLAICMLPIVTYIYSHSEIKDKHRYLKYVVLFYGFCGFMTLIGTQARTGLVALAAYALLLLMKSKHKLRAILAIVLIPLIFLPLATDEWINRMSSIEQGTTSEKSAVGRIVVWRWTLDYVSERPFFGGGFYAYNANAGILHHYQGANEVVIEQKGGKAFHNIFFEVLGEAGYGGLIIFLTIIVHTLSINRSLSKRFKTDDQTDDFRWVSPMANSINTSLLVYCAGGLFIGVAFYPWLYYLYGLSVSLLHIERKEAAA